MNTGKFLRNFEILARVSFALICLVIVAGSVVRASGAGMGCPDWPLCFGRLIPPVSESELPPDYREHYAIDGRFEDFNAVKTWTEYINRWVGVIAGFSLIALVVYSLRAFKRDKSFFAMSGLVLFLTLAEGFLGAIVVASYLQPIIVTLHLVLAIIIAVVLLRFVVHLQATRHLLQLGDGQPAPPVKWSRSLKAVHWVLFVLSIFQIVYGTQIREFHDGITWQNEPSIINAFLASLDWFYQFHAVVAVLVVVVSVAIALMLLTRRREETAGDAGEAFLARHGGETAFGWVLLGIAAAQTVLGFVMYFTGVPEWPKPIHLWLAIAVLLIQAVMYWRFIKPLPGRKFAG